MYEVSPRVNHATDDTPEVIKPVERVKAFLLPFSLVQSAFSAQDDHQRLLVWSLFHPEFPDLHQTKC